MAENAAVPRHLALVPDGNRRWAAARGMSAEDGHRAGIAAVGRVAEHAFAEGIEVVSFWWGSPTNLTLRDPREVEGIVGALHDFLRDEVPALLERSGASLAAFGRWQALAPSLIPVLDPLLGRPTRPRRLVVMMAYDGRDELRAAADALHGGGHTEAEFEGALWTASLPPVDLLIRTGGEPHLSAAFLLWKLADAQLAFPSVGWPDFDAAALDAVLATWGRTERRFGR